MSRGPQGQVRERWSTLADTTRRWVGALGLAVAVGIAYFLSARLSLALLVDDVAVFWPAAGIAAGVLIALGPQARVSVAVGTMAATIVANFLGDRNLWSTLVFALSNAGEAVLTAWLIERYFGRGFDLGRLNHVLGLVAAAIVGTTVSGIGGVVGFKLFEGSPVSAWTILAALDLIRRSRHYHGCAVSDWGRLNRAGAAIRQRARRRPFGDRGADSDKWICSFPPGFPTGDCRASRFVVPTSAVARGPLPPGVRRGWCVYR